MDSSDQNRSIDLRLDPESAAPDYEKAERELASRFGDRIRIFAAHRLHDAAAAEDIAQDTLRAVVAALRDRKIQNLDALPGFVFTTARNLCMHWTRSVARESAAFQRFRTTQSDAPEESHDALRDLIDEDRRRIVRKALNILSPDDRNLLSLLYFGGMSSDEAAVQLSITSAAVRVRKHRALQRLARLLGDDADGNTTDDAGTSDR
jgi:RNA polymerase sigma-70 factor (ECF subfamily)